MRNEMNVCGPNNKCVKEYFVANKQPGADVVEPRIHAVHLDDPDFIRHTKFKKFRCG